MEKPYRITCPFCKNKQIVYLQYITIKVIPYIECKIKYCKEIIAGELLDEVIEATNFFTPAFTNKY